MGEQSCGAMPGVAQICADDWPPPLTVLSESKLNSQNEFAFSKADFSGKEVPDLEGIDKFVSIADMNLSKNLLASLAGIEAVPGVRSLNIDENAVTELGPLSAVTALRVLTAKNNQVGSTAGLPPSVVSVDLLGNPVSELAGLDALAALTTLNLGDAKLASLAGLAAPALETLCIDNNAVASTEGIEAAVSLVTVQARGNKIAALTGLGEAHEKLSTLDLRDNEVATLEDLQPLETVPALKKLDLRGNPVCKVPYYKLRMLAMLSGIEELDGTDVIAEEKQEARIWWKEEQKRIAAAAEAAEAE